jgi:plasmid stabilization system protein ParE
LTRLRETRDFLIRLPHLGREARFPKMLGKGYRAFVMDDYVLYYKVSDGHVEVYHIVHGAQKPPETGNL